jgi:hypothetical protein
MQPTQPIRKIASDLSWKARLNTMFTKIELFGVRAANKTHRGFINLILVFIAWNGYTFVRNYNNYWRLRRDPNIPSQWLEEQEKPGSDDWIVEKERLSREERMIGRKGLAPKANYD